MKNEIKFTCIEPTIFLKKQSEKTYQLIRIKVFSVHAVHDAEIIVTADPYFQKIKIGPLIKGDNKADVFIEEPYGSAEYKFILRSDDIVYDEKKIIINQPRHWTVHVVQLSHHDPGYTDLPSNVLKDHFKWLEQAISYAEDTAHFPEDSRFRIVIEQAWSVINFLEHASEKLSGKMINMIKAGIFELTALFGNMVTEICGHEELIRSLYASYKLSHEHNIEIVSAEHNDIPGMSWGLCSVLAEAGVKLLCPGLPLYYSWGSREKGEIALRSFWDRREIFRHSGPGAVWWESQSGKRILLWNDSHGVGDAHHGSMHYLEDHLIKLQSGDYPYSVLRLAVKGGARDNSPYIPDYAYNIRDWNEKWEYPHLISSTNAMFYKDFIKQVPDDLPVIKGELPGQDYPSGAMSTAVATAQNRNNHAEVEAAEKIASTASVITDYLYQYESIGQAYEDMLWYDEHTWGFHFPCGPAMQASRHEKEIHSYRAAALSYDVISKAMAKIADNVRLDEEGFYLVIFNTCDFSRTTAVRTPMREMDNCGNTMFKVSGDKDKYGTGYLKGVLLGNRFHVNLPPEYIEGNFELIDMVSGKKVPFELIEVETPMDNVQYAAQRQGIGSGSRRYGFFEIPKGLKYDLCFIAEDIPANGYKTFSLISGQKDHKYMSRHPDNDTCKIENEYYRILVDNLTGTISSILDKKSGHELTDADSEHGFNAVIIREPELKDKIRPEYHQRVIKTEVKDEGIYRSIQVTSSAYSLPVIKQEIILYQGIKRIYLNTKIFKGPEPLLDGHIAFPFYSKNPVFRYEGVLSIMNPIDDYLPGAYSDIVGIGNWVRIDDSGKSILWSSIDSPVAGFGRLHPGYVSPAHRCQIDAMAAHEPSGKDELDKAWIYSNIFNNNFGTNFYVSQSGEMLFRYVITTSDDDNSDSCAARFGKDAVTAVPGIITKRLQGATDIGMLPVYGSIYEIVDKEIMTIAFKKAEDGEGYILRLWNVGATNKETTIEFKNIVSLNEAHISDIVEKLNYRLEIFNGRAIKVKAGPKEIITIYIKLS